MQQQGGSGHPNLAPSLPQPLPKRGMLHPGHGPRRGNRHGEEEPSLCYMGVPGRVLLLPAAPAPNPSLSQHPKFLPQVLLCCRMWLCQAALLHSETVTTCHSPHPALPSPKSHQPHQPSSRKPDTPSHQPLNLPDPLQTPTQAPGQAIHPHCPQKAALHGITQNRPSMEKHGGEWGERCFISAPICP